MSGGQPQFGQALGRWPADLPVGRQRGVGFVGGEEDALARAGDAFEQRPHFVGEHL